MRTHISSSLVVAPVHSIESHPLAYSNTFSFFFLVSSDDMSYITRSRCLTSISAMNVQSITHTTNYTLWKNPCKTFQEHRTYEPTDLLSLCQLVDSTDGRREWLELLFSQLGIWEWVLMGAASELHSGCNISSHLLCLPQHHDRSQAWQIHRHCPIVVNSEKVFSFLASFYTWIKLVVGWWLGKE